MTSRLLASAKGGGLFDQLAPGLYAWAVTVAWPVSHRFAPLGSRIFALIAVVALVSGAALTYSSLHLARIVGIWVFLASCMGAWALVSSSIAPLQLDPVQGLLGSLGWGFFAVSWAGQTRDVPEPRPDPAQPDARVAPRQTVPRSVTHILGAVALAASIPMVLAWWVQSLERALLAHAIALAVAIALVAFAVDMFDPRSRELEKKLMAPIRPQRRLRRAAPSLVALVVLTLLGAGYSLLR
jgi:hypothetical protein